MVPRISQEHRLSGEVVEGNLAYDKSDVGISLYVGDEPVVDPTSLHGTADVLLSNKDYTIELDNATKGENSEYFYVYGMAQVGYVIVKSINHPIDIEYSTHYAKEVIGLNDKYIKVTKLDNFTIQFAISTTDMDFVGVGNLQVRISKEEVLNDLTVNRFKLKDTEGQIYFHKLRDWTKHLYDGNRGEDWSKYKASSTINLNGHSIIHDADGKFTSTSRVIKEGEITNRILTMTAMGEDCLLMRTIYNEDGGGGSPLDPDEVDLKFTAITPNMNGAEKDTVDIYVSAKGDYEILIEGCTDLKEQEWRPIPILKNLTTTIEGEYYIKGFRVYNDRMSAFFYRAVIRESGTKEVTRVEVVKEIEFQDKVIFKRNGHTYRLDFPEEGGQVTVTRLD